MRFVNVMNQLNRNLELALIRSRPYQVTNYGATLPALKVATDMIGDITQLANLHSLQFALGMEI
jgi:hypothetical protein